MPTFTEPVQGHRSLELVIGDESATTRTSLRFDGPRERLRLATAFDLTRVTADGIRSHRRADGAILLDGVESQAVVVVEGTIKYRGAIHGLCQWIDPADARRYVVGSGALGGAAHFTPTEDGPADRMQTDLKVTAAETVRVARSPLTDSQAPTSLAGHQLGLVAGPWACASEGDVEVLSRQALGQHAQVLLLLQDTRRVLDWMAGWFEAASAPWGTTYTQVLLPDTAWLGMEHPGCVLLSERLLSASPAQRVSVLAHEVAHQWLGNLVSPRRWADVGIIEGAAELLGQLACEDLVGAAALRYLGRERASKPLAVPALATGLRDLPETAGLAEVAAPVHHAELLRVVRAELGDVLFQGRMRELVGAAQGHTVSAADVWSALGVEAREPAVTRLPRATGPVSAAWRSALEELAVMDPATAARLAGRLFRASAPGPSRIRRVLAVIDDPRTPPAVTAGLAAELAVRRRHP